MTLTTQNTLTIEQALGLASQFQIEGKLQQSEVLLKRILEVNPNHAHALHLLGIIAHQVGKNLLGIQLIEQAIASNATNAMFHSNLGEMYRQSGNVSLAIKHGQQAVKLDPNLATAHANLGIAFYDEKKYEQAEECHRKALALNPKLDSALNNMGSINKERKNTSEAMRYYKEAIDAAPHNPEPLNNLGAMHLSEHHFEQAIETISRALTISPNFADAHSNLGLAWNGLENYDKATFHFQRALHFKPTHAQAHLGLGKVHRNQNSLDTAEKLTLKAIELDPSKAESYEALASIYGEMGEIKKAMSYFDLALSIEPDLSNALLGKGKLFVELGDKKSAETLIKKTLQADTSQPTQLSAYCSLVQLTKVKENDPAFTALLQYDVQKLAPTQQQYLHFALGKCYDDVGEHAKAFEYYHQGCQLKRSRIHYDQNEQEHLADRIIECFTKNSIQLLRESFNKSDIPIFVLGMPRSGTTLTEQIIASHPSVHGAGELTHLSTIINRPVEKDGIFKNYPENLFYFSPDERKAMADTYIKELSAYAPTHARITDKMPGNFWSIGFIHALMPNAKIIHVERNPLDTCLSCYTRLFQNGQYFSYDLTELGQYYKTYQRVMAHWHDVLPEGAFLTVRYENLVANLEIEARRLIEYCDLEWDPLCLSFHTLKRQVRTASLTQVREPIYKSSIERWRCFEHQLQPLIDALNLDLAVDA